MCVIQDVILCVTGWHLFQHVSFSFLAKALIATGCKSLRMLVKEMCIYKFITNLHNSIFKKCLIYYACTAKVAQIKATFSYVFNFFCFTSHTKVLALCFFSHLYLSYHFLLLNCKRGGCYLKISKRSKLSDPRKWFHID